MRPECGPDLGPARAERPRAAGSDVSGQVVMVMAGLLGEVVYRDGPLCERSAPEERLLNFGRGRRRFQASFRRVTASATGGRIIKTTVPAPPAKAIAKR